jgi:6-phosphofructokinase 1
MSKRIAILTGGGHISSFHAGIKGIVDRARESHTEVIGFRDGYKGAKEGDYIILNHKNICNHLAGSLLGSTRDKADERVGEMMKKLSVDALIVMGGDDHLKEAAKLHEMGVPVVGWPKTMDNDLSMTYFCMGHPTAVVQAANMLRYAHANAQTNSRIHIVTMFGRNTDWVVAGAGAWGHADIVVPCEQEYSFDYISDRIQRAADDNLSRYNTRFAVVAVAEGARIKGLESHLNDDEMDVHGNPKIEPMRLALVLKDAFKKIDERCVSIDSISYMMRDSPPINKDRDLAYNAGNDCLLMAICGELGMAATFIKDSQGMIRLGRKPLSAVSQKRYLKPEGFIDYENLKVNDSFVKYYAPLFGEPVDRKTLIYSK